MIVFPSCMSSCRAMNTDKVDLLYLELFSEISRKKHVWMQFCSSIYLFSFPWNTCKKFRAHNVSTLVWQAHQRIHILCREQIICLRELRAVWFVRPDWPERGLWDSCFAWIYSQEKNNSKTNTPGKLILKMFLSSSMLWFLLCVRAIDVMKWEITCLAIVLDVSHIFSYKLC